MAVTITEISTWLDNSDIKYNVSEKKESTILIGFPGEKGFLYAVQIEVEEDGELFQVYCNLLIGEDRKILKVKEHKYTSLVLQHILTINYKEKFGTWEFDPEDGEVRFAVEIPLEDAEMTEKQFRRIIGSVIHSDKKFLEILKIMETGELPEDEDVNGMLASLMSTMLADRLQSDLEKHGGDVSALLESLKADIAKTEDEDGI